MQWRCSEREGGEIETIGLLAKHYLAIRPKLEYKEHTLSKRQGDRKTSICGMTLDLAYIIFSLQSQPACPGANRLQVPRI